MKCKRCEKELKHNNKKLFCLGCQNQLRVNPYDVMLNALFKIREWRKHINAMNHASVFDDNIYMMADDAIAMAEANKHKNTHTPNRGVKLT